MLIITEFVNHISFFKIQTEFPSKTSQILSKLHHFFSHFFTKSSSICFVLDWFMLYMWLWWTVLQNSWPNLQEFQLSKACTTMASSWFLHLELFRAKLASPFTFLINKLHLFSPLEPWGARFRNCCFIRSEFKPFDSWNWHVV